jgi:hypothetical protein
MRADIRGWVALDFGNEPFEASAETHPLVDATP